jgi:TQO small subunit DoxD
MAISSHDRSPAIAESKQRVAGETATDVVGHWERRLKQFALVLARLGLAYLFFTQLWWKAPPTYGCPTDFHFTTGTPSQLQRSGGLCDWIGIESVYATQPHRLLVANIDNRGAPEIAIDIGWLARLNGAFIDNVVKPNIRWFGSVIFFTEAFIFVSLFLGLFSRLGGLVAIGMSAQLMVGLAGIPNPYEWEWAYINMVLLAVAVFAFVPGRIWGLDALLRPRLQAAAPNGSRIAKAVLALT